MAFEDDGVSPLRVVSARDPAIDRAKTNVRKYAETRDATLLAFRPGTRPRWWVLNPLTVDDILGVENAPTAKISILRAFQYGLDAIEGHQSDGTALRGAEPIDGSSPLRKIWGKDDLAVVLRCYGLNAIYEMGSIIYQRADRGNAWSGGADCFTVPPALLSELEAIERQSAA